MQPTLLAKALPSIQFVLLPWGPTHMDLVLHLLGQASPNGAQMGRTPSLQASVFSLAP